MKRMIRVLLTNGVRTVELYWIHHKGTDIYYGNALMQASHFSYHGSGAHLRKTPGGHESLGEHLPLADFKGYFSLATVAVATSILSGAPKMPAFKWSKKSEALIVLDVRTMPKRKVVNVMVALVEPGRTDLLAAPRIQTQQVVLLTSVTPWVEVAVVYG